MCPEEKPMFDQVQQFRTVLSSLGVSTSFSSAVSLRISGAARTKRKVKAGQIAQPKAGGREAARSTAFFEAVKRIV